MLFDLKKLAKIVQLQVTNHTAINKAKKQNTQMEGQ